MTFGMIICLFVYTGTGLCVFVCCVCTVCGVGGWELTYIMNSRNIFGTHGSVAIVTVIVISPSGVCGFLSFGSNVSQDVLMSYPPNDIAVAIARAFIVVCVVTSYPILHFCGR